MDGAGQKLRQYLKSGLTFRNTILGFTASIHEHVALGGLSLKIASR